MASPRSVPGGADTTADRRTDRAVARLLHEDWRGFPPYKKWEGAHWRLLSLVELGVTDGAATGRMLDAELDWLTGHRHRSSIATVAGLVRRCASQEGAALLVAARVGATDDPRARLLAESLVAWQWPDGGWNCDARADAYHSSFHETLLPLRGLAAFGAVTGDQATTAAARRAARLLLDHRLCRSRTSGEVIDPRWLRIHWPAYWHYDVLQGLRGVADAGLVGDPDAAEALAWLRDARRPDGTWAPTGRRYWRPPGSGRSNVEVVDWTDLAVPLITAQVEAVLKAIDRTTQ